ncbi:MAG: hypothetical protein QXL01_00225 [Thermoplasmatales archaeon]
MSFLNLNYGLIIFEDASDRNPNIKLTDISKTIVNACVDNEESEKFHLNANETVDIVTTLRSLSWSPATELKFQRYIANEDPIRLVHTGVGPAPAFRTNRAIGGSATTAVTITRSSPYVARITQTAGTAWTLGSVQVGDIIKFEKSTDTFTSPLSEVNRGKSYVVQAKGANYIEYLDNGESSLDSGIVLGSDYEFAVRVFSPGPVKVGDTIDLSGSGLNPSNRGQFTITDLSYDYVEFTNPFSIAETILYSTNVINIYDYLIGFIHLRASGQIKIRFGDQSEWMTIDRLQTEALFMGSVETYRVQAFNDGQDAVSISVQHARVNQ